MSRTAPRPLSEPLRALTAALSPAAGPAIAAAARPTGERAGVLTVRCEAAVWAQELELIAPELIPRLNAALGGEAIRELRCRTA